MTCRQSTFNKGSKRATDCRTDRYMFLSFLSFFLFFFVCLFVCQFFLSPTICMDQPNFDNFLLVKDHVKDYPGGKNISILGKKLILEKKNPWGNLLLNCVNISYQITKKEMIPPPPFLLFSFLCFFFFFFNFNLLCGQWACTCLILR